MAVKLEAVDSRVDRQNDIIGTTMLYVIDLRGKLDKAGVEVDPLPEDFKNLGRD